MLSISKDNIRLEVTQDSEVNEDYIQIHVYECQAQFANDPKIPPFNHWECIEGNDAVPFVAYIE